MAKSVTKKLKPIRLVKKANDLIEARHNLTTWEMRIFLKIVFLVNEEVHKGKTNFIIPIRELIKDFRLENNRQSYTLFREARKALATRSIQLYQQNKDTDRWEMVNKSLFIETAHSVKMSDDGIITDDDDGYIRLQLHEQIKPYLLNVNGSLNKNYTLFDRNYAIELPNKIFRFYLLLKRFADTGFRQMTIEELRDVFDLQGKYKNFGSIKQRIINKAQVELAEKTDIRFDYQEVKKAGTKTVVAIKFKIYLNEPPNKPLEIPEKTRDRVAEKHGDVRKNSDGNYEKVAGRVTEKHVVSKETTQPIDTHFDTHFDTYFMLMREYGVSASTLTGWLQQHTLAHIEACWQSFVGKVASGQLREKDKTKQGGYLRTLIEQADFSEKQKKAVLKADVKNKSDEQKSKETLELVRKKQTMKQEFERDTTLVDMLFKEDPTLEQTILDQINGLDQTAYTKENVADLPFLKPKIIFRLKQQFPDVFKI